MNATDWFQQPLSEDDLIAGLSLLLIGTIGILFYIFVACVLLKYSEETIGFRYLFSSAIVDSLALFQYGTWPGLTILFKSEIIPISMRHVVQAYIDWVWFSMCYHYSVVAFSRLSAIRFPIFFRQQTKFQSYLICSPCYVVALIQTIINQQLSCYVLFYYDPSSYGIVAEDFEKYRTDGHMQYMDIYNLLCIIAPFLIYAIAIFFLFIHKQQTQQTSAALPSQQNSSKAEINLMVPCILNTVVFLVGQVLLTVGWGAGIWVNWSILILFCIQSLANPILLIIFSSTIRQKMAMCLKISKMSQSKKSTTANLMIVSGDSERRMSMLMETRKASVLSRSNVQTVIPNVG